MFDNKLMTIRDVDKSDWIEKPISNLLTLKEEQKFDELFLT